MENHHPKQVEDYMTANMILIFVNLLWILVAIWSAWGLVPVLIVVVVINHLITRLDHFLRRRSGELDRA
jgi:hypothetical protein